MAYHKQYAQLLYQYEILQARLSVREHFLKTVVREVYENIGQVLSLIRVQLSSLQPEFDTGNREGINSSGELVGQTIRELRTMCRLFYPEENIIFNKGLSEAIAAEIKSKYPYTTCDFPKEENVFSGIDADQSLLLYSILLELLELLQSNQDNILTKASLKQQHNHICIILDYSGVQIRKPRAAKQEGWQELSVFERVELMKGKLEIKKTGTDTRRIKLELPTA